MNGRCPGRASRKRKRFKRTRSQLACSQQLSQPRSTNIALAHIRQIGFLACHAAIRDIKQRDPQERESPHQHNHRYHPLYTGMTPYWLKRQRSRLEREHVKIQPFLFSFRWFLSIFDYLLYYPSPESQRLGYVPQNNSKHTFVFWSCAWPFCWSCDWLRTFDPYTTT
jgi:hypothetical protein